MKRISQVEAREGVGGSEGRTEGGREGGREVERKGGKGREVNLFRTNTHTAAS